MAEDDETRQPNGTDNVDEDQKEKDLKYLDFVNAAILYVVVSVAWLYEHVRDKSGPLKPAIHALESSIKFVTAPVFRKFHGAPFNLLQFLDHKVEESIERVVKRTPAAAYARCSPTAKELYGKYEPVAVEYAVLGWRVVQWIPVIGQATRVWLPVVKCGVRVYNWGVRKAKRRGYKGASYMPEVPTDIIAKLFSGTKTKIN